MEGLQWFVDLGASVMLPVIIFIFALILGTKVKKAIQAGLTVGIGFVGLNLILELLTSSLGPAAKSMVEYLGFDLRT
ncbi:PTS galactitol transporter subunit IIC, partial [Virgibacillus halodenitrificans]|nr:PTS galactitol transporter subunit IIC [Virgibacillus halodenitrificans]